MKSFASDNYSGIAPEIMQAIIEANKEHQPAYGDDIYTQQAKELLRETFGPKTHSYFAFNGTGANCAALKAIIKSHHAILCSDQAHILNQEVGAITNLSGCSLIPINSNNGKITAEAIQDTFKKAMFYSPHSTKPKVVSITQPTELGTIYTLDELKAIAMVCKEHNLLFHMDGCRLSNAAVALNCSLAALTSETGVDALSFGGAKNGLMLGEAIIFFREELQEEFAYIHKQTLQLNSKMRFMSAQFIPYLKDHLWHKYASHANKMCHYLAEQLSILNEVKLAYPVQTNQLFAYVPEHKIKETQAKYPYYIWEEPNLIRLVTSFDTTYEDVDTFISLLK